MKQNFFSERGQALIVLALAAIGIFGIVGLAIDGSAKFSDRRHAQNAADTAAMAGALELARDDTANWINTAKNVADENGYDGNLVSNQVWVYYCDAIPVSSPVDCGPYNNYHSYIQVVISSRVNTSFAKVVGIQQTQNIVQAVAYTDKGGPLYKGDAIIQLNPTGSGCPGEFIVGGSGTVTIDGGGLFVNSNNTGNNNCAAFTQAGCNTTLNVINGGGITAVGQIFTDPCNGVDKINANETEGAAPYPFPPPPEEVPAPPPECAAGVYGYVQNNYPSNGISTIWPGKYDTLPPANATENTVVMLPGNYCVFEAVKVTGSNSILQGDNVFIYIRYNSTKTFPLSLQGGTVDIDAPDTGDYKGYLIYVDPGPIVNGMYTGNPKNCSISGSSTNAFTGSIYAPYCEMTINGGGSPYGFHAQLIAYEVKLDGNNALTFIYSAGDNGVKRPRLGLMR
jgi:Flp pilus assembly protein TadG